MILNFVKNVAHKFHRHPAEELSSDLREYLENFIYPRNHNFTLCNGKLLPKHKLASRHRKISKLYPKQMNSFLDLSCCKGFFVLSASQNPGCQRSLGIDINQRDIEVCHTLKAQLNLVNADFKVSRLDELAQQINQYGGPFQTVLLANTYQYLYFGSEWGEGYKNHDKIFNYIQQICSHRLIFTNRTEVEDCQNKKQVKQAGEFSDRYNTYTIIKAAEKYFIVKPEGKIGSYPLWLLERR